MRVSGCVVRGERGVVYVTGEGGKLRERESGMDEGVKGERERERGGGVDGWKEHDKKTFHVRLIMRP